jgi:hypothetical protein
VVKLRVDGLPPHVAVKVRRGQVLVHVRDRDSGLRAGSTSVSFGDGTRDHGGAKFHHAYASPGRYTIFVRARDEVGNRVARRFEAVAR